MKNFKLIIQYDGSFFHGWQIQPDQITVQGSIEKVLSSIFLNQKISVIGAGRTDSGVHALGQVANILIDTEFSSDNIKNILNANLEKKIWITNCQETDLDFHARFSAISRVYEYHITRLFSPFDYKKATLINYDINKNKLLECSKLVKGKRDFSSFCKANSEVKNKICNVTESFWTFSESKLIYHVRANRFLQHMVRLLVGSMLEVARNKISLDEFGKLLLNKSSLSSLRAPADGLYLTKVVYE